MRVDASCETVFPLLCPVREYEWIAHWRCEMVHSRSGVAEDGCVFRTDFPDDGRMTWVVTSYEPPRRIEFCCFVPETIVMRLKIRLTPDGAGCRLGWTREFLALSDGGDEHIRLYRTEERHRAMMEMLKSSLESFLACSASAK